MRRRSRASGQLAKTRRRETVTLKRSNAPKAKQARRTSASARETEIARLTRERNEALEQQAATSEVLRVISSSPGELEPVFKYMLDNAVRLCEAKFGNLLLYEKDAFRIVAMRGAPPAWDVLRQRDPVIRFSSVNPLGRIVASNELQHITDFMQEESYIRREPGPVAMVELAGARTVLVAPLLRQDELIGVIAVYRQEVRPFTERQIALLKSFADQAVIAVENARLLKGLRERTADLSESLEQQTATSEVLRVISSSRGDLSPIFEAMLASATRICQASFANLLSYDGNVFRRVALHNAPQAWAAAWQGDTVIHHRSAPVYRIAETKQVVHITDMAVECPDQPITKLANARTLMVVPMLKENELIGAIGIYRQEVRSFTAKQIEVIQNFANQAVIAIENVRLLNELRQRTSDLSESLQQQTATSDVLGVISRSPGELKPVFDTVLENATRLCEATFGTLYRFENGAFWVTALRNAPPEFAAFLQGGPHRPSSASTLGRAAHSRKPTHVVDITAEPCYLEGDPYVVEVTRISGARTILVVPMLRESELVGAIAIYRREVRPFTDKQIELVQSFAAQAVIAIENTRLLNELRESLQQQTATADVLKVISRSKFELQPVLDTLVESATRLCEAYDSIILLRQGEKLHLRAHHGPIPFDIAEWPIGPGWVTGRAVFTREPVHVHDLQAPASAEEFPEGTEMALRLGHRTTLAVPLMRENEAIGAILIRRTEVRPFSDKQIELVKTFADQAVIAIENARLFDEVQARTHELSQSVEELRALSEVSQAINSTLDIETVLTTIVTKAVRPAQSIRSTNRVRNSVCVRHTEWTTRLSPRSRINISSLETQCSAELQRPAYRFKSPTFRKIRPLRLMSFSALGSAHY
jgi:two-component system NtrC family sensor kinase